MYALFSKVGGRWRFEGFLSDPTGVAVGQYTRTIEREIRETKDLPVPTQSYKVVNLI